MPSKNRPVLYDWQESEEKEKMIGKRRYAKRDEVMTTCRCPKCRELHRMKIFWTGRGMPWKYCHDCKLVINSHAIKEASVEIKSLARINALGEL